MNILMITENDPAGMGIAFTRAINRHTQHQCRLITTTTRYNFNFEKDLHTSDLNEEGYEEIVDLLEKTDIIHFHILADENIELGPVKVKDFIRGKTLLHHHHGHPDFRAHPEKYMERYRRKGRKALVSTPDLLKLLPEAVWQPNIVPINDPLYLPNPVPTNGTMIIGQSVTRKDLKNTEELIEAVHRANTCCASMRFDLDLIENTDHKECLERKNRCHVIFDHMQGYYGVSSLESLSQGKPVIAGIDEWNEKWIEAFTGSENIPWIIAHNGIELKEKIIEIMDEEGRRIIGERSRNWMEKYWSDEIVTRRLIDYYCSLQS